MTRAHNLQHCVCFRFFTLVPFEGAHCPQFSTVYGHFPPEVRFNQDKVPLSFAATMDCTCALSEDKHAHLSCPNESLCKRKFTIQMIDNVVVGEKKLNFTALIHKCSPNGLRKQCEIPA